MDLPTLTWKCALLWSRKTVSSEGERFFHWEDQVVPAVAHDDWLSCLHTQTQSVHAPTSYGATVGYQLPPFGLTSFSLVAQGDVCIPFLMPWNKTLCLLSCHRGVGSPHSPSACSAAMHAARLHSQCTPIRSWFAHYSCWLLCLMASIDQHFLSGPSDLPSLCQAVAPGTWVNRDSVHQLRCFCSKEPWRLPAPRTRRELYIDGHHPHVAGVLTVPPSEAWWKHPDLSLSARWA